jgi:tetratricopeptide (TPR) repeat protein
MDQKKSQLRNPPPRNTGVKAEADGKGKSLSTSRIRKYWWIILFPLFLTVVVAVAALTGYQRGLKDRQTAQVQQETSALLDQFNLGIEDLTAGRYDLAKQRAEYILSVDPNNEAAIGLLDLALKALNQPTLTPTALVTATMTTPTATPDLSSVESHYASAEAAFNRGDWNEAIALFVDLRANHSDYRKEDVDQMLFTALRNRGFNNILQGNQEQGIYDLSLAERFGPLDNQAASWRRSAEFYLFANSYVGLDWLQAYQLFSDLCGAAIWDSCYKFALSARSYGDLLLATADPCGALFPYEQSLMTLYDGELATTATGAAKMCMTATAATPTETPTPEGTETETLTPTSTNNIVSTSTFTPTATSSPPSTTVTPSPTNTVTQTASMTPSPTASPSATP